MKKIGILAVIIMLMAIVTAAQAEVRAGGLPPIDVNDSIKDCNCRLFPECCAQPVAAPVPAPEPTPAPAPEPNPAPAPVKEKVTITLNVQFDTNKAVIKEKYNDDIKKVADFMKEFPDTTAEIGGHTDNIASAAYNQKLSEKRANSVRQYLIDKFGIDGSRLTAVGYGLTKPVAGNDTEEGRQQNRRVEAVMEAVRTVYK
ncbi:MAG: OmpA family protein [Smithella sp.]|jgi:OOP family OmpA-OmpF porin